MDSPLPPLSDCSEPTSHNVGPAPPRGPFTVADVFLGADGLRAMWGTLLFAALCVALFICVHPVLLALFPSPFDTPGLPTPRRTVASEGEKFLCVAVATWLMAKIEHRPTSAYGFARQRSVRNFCAGLAWGVALLSLLVIILWATGLLVFDARLLFGSSALRYGAVWLAGFVLVGLFEEFASRGYLQFTLTRALSEIYRRLFGETHANALAFWTAALFLSFAFGFGHRTNPGESPLGLLSAGAAGLLFCLSLWRTGSLWWAIGFHTSWDWAQSFLYGVADSGLMVQGHLYATHPVGRPILSGGLTGPEGSLFMLLVMATAAGVIVLTLPRSHFGYIPREASEPSLH
jgi:uncharacterized protein